MKIMKASLLGLKSGTFSSLEDYIYLREIVVSPVSGIGRDTILVRTLRQLKQKAKAELARENMFLDSLETNNLISHKVGEFFRSRNLFLRSILGFEIDGRIDFSDHNIVKTLFSGEHSKSLISHVFFQRALKDYQNYLTRSKTPEHKISTYDSISHINTFDSATAASLKFNLADEFYGAISEREKQTIDVTLRTVFPELVLNAMYDRHSLIDIFSDDFVFTQTNGQPIAGDVVKLCLRGKVVYVNFWASWCLPCISEMPKLKGISDKFGNDVAVVNLSVDKDQKRWLRASSVYLADFENSFYLDSVARTRLEDTYKLHSVPRYMLFDRNGDLIHNNAPKPGTPELIDLIETYFEFSTLN